MRPIKFILYDTQTQGVGTEMGTMWQSDQKIVLAKAKRKMENGTLGKENV